MLCQIDAPAGGATTGYVCICDTQLQAIAKSAANAPKATAGPNAARQPPPRTAPRIAEPSHVLENQAEAFIISGGGMICASHAEIAGSAKPRAMPATNTTA